MLELLTNFAVRFLGRVIPLAVSWYYTPARMGQFVQARLAPEGDGVQLWAGDLPHADAWIVVTNFSPFPIELDRAVLRVTFGAPVVEMISLRRAVIPPSSEGTWMFNAALTVFQANYIQKNYERVEKVDLAFSAQFFCRVNDFSAQKNVSTAHFKLFNFKVPIGTWLKLENGK
ncbi:MAG: hypothetical protein ACT6Q9_09665 [Polaromonas sp.]|uniref:hypothetical protein n=1 Tax=Polaromonas sp. TaxID=1869339 RepID=UPI004036FC1C